MALIKCSECGKEISDKAASCPGCGCPVEVEKGEESKSDLEKLADEICSRNADRVKAIKELREATGMDLKSAMDIMDLRYKGATSNQEAEKRKEERKLEKKERRDAFYDWCEKTRADARTPKCPKCKSTSITYTNKKLSIGRAVVGGAIIGAPGAVLGGLSSKKGYAVCLNCGKRWKL